MGHEGLGQCQQHCLSLHVIVPACSIGSVCILLSESPGCDVAHIERPRPNWSNDWGCKHEPTLWPVCSSLLHQMTAPNYVS
jgi:hypothetical protein